MRTFLLLLLFSVQLHAQQTFQNIKGSVTDRDSKKPLQGATVNIAETANTVLTDGLGNFILKNIPTGRIRIQVTYTGYQSYLSDYIILNAAKESEFDVEM
jgi:hypothetical protein